MLYMAFEWGVTAFSPARYAAAMGAHMMRSPLNPMAETWFGRSTAAALEVFEHAVRRYPKPTWGIADTTVNGKSVPVTIETVSRKSFCSLLHFRRDPDALRTAHDAKTRPDPVVLIIAPLSGHHATLLRGTVEAMIPDHEVYVTDWADARTVPVAIGRFDMNDYIDYLMGFLRTLHEIHGERAHSMAVCQPGPCLLAAASLMAEADESARPASMVIMGSPIDTRRSPTVPNIISQERPFDWFENNMIYTVPPPYPGMLRRVYPSFIQLYSFMSMNSNRHFDAHYDYFQHLVEGDGDSADKHRGFYDEYLAVLDLTEEFYLQTIQDVFQQHKLPEGLLTHHGQRVKPEAITDIALMTVEGEKDDISGIGQTQAAHDLCINIPDRMRLDYIQKNVGHYGVFNGSRWRNEIQPKIAEFIRTHHHAAKTGLRLVEA